MCNLEGIKNHSRLIRTRILSPRIMISSNGLICFTNCLLPQEDGSLLRRDLWVDERYGTILDAQKTFYLRKERPDKTIDLEGNILSPGFIDIQINGAYGFDFSVYENDDSYRRGLGMVAQRIIETGVTSLLPTVVTQEKSIYPKLLSLLKPVSTDQSATLLGWHAEGPFIDRTKRGAHEPAYLLSALDGFKSFEVVYGAQNLVESSRWFTSSFDPAVRLVTAAPEVPGVMKAIDGLVERGISVSIGHSVASTEIATAAIQHGTRLITHLFNAMPQLHHRDPSIIGLLGTSPHASLSNPISVHFPCNLGQPLSPGTLTPADSLQDLRPVLPGSEAFDHNRTPPDLTVLPSMPHSASLETKRPALHLEKGQIADMPFDRPFYGIIVDGIHCHPNSVRLAYSSHPDGCILITDAMKILDPNLADGVHEWRDGRKFVKEGEKLYLEGTTTLAGSIVTMEKCVRNFSRFTGCSLGEAIRCATYNPAKCLGIENKKGTLRPGAHADLVVLDRQGILSSTWVRGKEAWLRQVPHN